LDKAKGETMNIALYARVSSETQEKDGTIESQIEALHEYAKTHRLQIAYECLDDGYSGEDFIRPGLDQLRDLTIDGKVDGILVLCPDRLARKNAHQGILLEEFKKRNVKVIFTNQNYEDTADGNFMLQIQGAVAEYERAKILDRMRRGTIHAVKNGQIIGGQSALWIPLHSQVKNQCRTLGNQS
jgi:site-specific DNA recombinase